MYIGKHPCLRRSAPLHLKLFAKRFVSCTTIQVVDKPLSPISLQNKSLVEVLVCFDLHVLI